MGKVSYVFKGQGKVGIVLPGEEDISMLNVFRGGSITNVTTDDYAEINVLKGASATKVGLTSARMGVYEGASVSDVTVDNGEMVLNERASAANVTLKGYGLLTLDEDATATNVTVEAGGSINGFTFGENTVTVADASRLSNVTAGEFSWEATVSEGMSVTGVTVDGSQLNVEENATVADVTLKDFSYLYVYEDGTATNVTVHENSQVYLYEGATVTNVTVNAGGSINGFTFGESTVTIADAYSLSNAIVDSNLTWDAVVTKGMSVTDVTVKEYSRLSMYGNATVTNVTVEAYGSINGFTFGESTVTVADASHLSNVTVEEWDYAYVNKGQIVDGVTVEAEGMLYVQKGGSSTNITVKADGTINGFSFGENTVTVADASHLSNVTVDDSYDAYVFEGQSATDVTVNDNRMLKVYEGGSATNITVEAYGSINGFTFGESTVTVADASHLSNVMVEGYSSATINGGQTADGVTIEADSRLYVYEGGSATNVTVKEYGLINGFTFGENPVTIADASHLSNVTVHDGGHAQIYGGQTAAGVTVEEDSSLYVSEAEDDGKVASVTDVTVNARGRLNIDEGATAANVTLNGGEIEVDDDAVVTNLTMNKDSLAKIDGGTLTGTLTFTVDETVVYFEDGLFNFDVSARSADAAALINKLSLIQGTPTFAVTVAAEQATGIYTLAGSVDGFDGFNNTLTIGTADTEFGTLTVNGGSISHGLLDYSLIIENDNLLLAVQDNNYAVSGSGSGMQEVPLRHAGKYTLSGSFGDITGSVAVLNGGKKVATGSLKDGKLTVKKGQFLLDSALETAVQVTIKKGTDTQYSVSLDADVVFNKGDSDSPDAPRQLGSLTEAGKQVVSDGWVGYGDEYDYLAFTLDTAANLSLDYTSTDTAKFTIKNAATGKSVMNSTVKAGKELSTKFKQLDAGNYYLVVQSTNAKKGGDADYTITVNKDSRFYPAGDNTNDTWQAASGQTAKLAGEEITGWVGYGDAKDFIKIQVAENGKVSLDLDEATANAYAAKQIKLTCLNDKGKSVALTSFDGDTLVSKKDVQAGIYYLGVTCASVKKFDTSYKITTGLLAV